MHTPAIVFFLRASRASFVLTGCEIRKHRWTFIYSRMYSRLLGYYFKKRRRSVNLQADAISDYDSSG